MALGPYRTTAELVEALVDVQPGFDVTPFIAIANQITTDVCGPMITGVDTDESSRHRVRTDSSYTDGYVNSKMELIERWLSAHFYQMYDMTMVSAHAGPVGASYAPKIGYGLKLTLYGQSAILLDTSGRLASLDNVNQTRRKIRIGGHWLGDNRYRYYDQWFQWVE